MKIKKNVILAPFTTFGIGGRAKYFVVAKTTQEIIQAVRWAKEKKVLYFILAGGSNILLPDEGVRGLVIKMKNEKLKIKNLKLYCESGVLVNFLVNETVSSSWSGFEYFAGLPGTIGGAIYNNSHWQKHFMSDNLLEVEILDKDLKRRRISKKELRFKYNSSIFQEKNWIILKAVFKLKKNNLRILKNKVRVVLKAREKQPKGKSAGCIFKNPAGKSAGYLIDQAGLKGKKLGGILISPEHANFFINLGSGKAKEVLELMKIVQEEVLKKFAIKLQPEIFTFHG